MVRTDWREISKNGALGMDLNLRPIAYRAIALTKLSYKGNLSPHSAASDRLACAHARMVRLLIYIGRCSPKHRKSRPGKLTVGTVVKAGGHLNHRIAFQSDLTPVAFWRNIRMGLMACQDQNSMLSTPFAVVKTARLTPVSRINGMQISSQGRAIANSPLRLTLAT